MSSQSIVELLIVYTHNITPWILGFLKYSDCVELLISASILLDYPDVSCIDLGVVYGKEGSLALLMWICSTSFAVYGKFSVIPMDDVLGLDLTKLSCHEKEIGEKWSHSL